MHHSPDGFTLIELMLAVAIVGLIAAIAIPSYRDYVVRAKVSEMILAGTNAKISIAESAQISGSLKDSGIGITIGTEGRYLSTASVQNNGVIIITAFAKTLGATGDVTLVLSPKLEASGTITWACSSQGNPVYVPSTCR